MKFLIEILKTTIKNNLCSAEQLNNRSDKYMNIISSRNGKRAGNGFLELQIRSIRCQMSLQFTIVAMAMASSLKWMSLEEKLRIHLLE